MSQKKKQNTKQGIKRLSLDDNLFKEIEDDDCAPNDKFEKKLDESFSDKRFNEKVTKQKTKQGVKKLSLEDDLFNNIEKENEPEENFDELLEESLSDISSQNLIKEKISVSSEKIELSKSTKLSKYPKPQDEIDLHGLKGNEALSKENADGVSGSLFVTESQNDRPEAGGRASPGPRTCLQRRSGERPDCRNAEQCRTDR